MLSAAAAMCACALLAGSGCSGVPNAGVHNPIRSLSDRRASGPQGLKSAKIRTLWIRRTPGLRGGTVRIKVQQPVGQTLGRHRSLTSRATDERLQEDNGMESQDFRQIRLKVKFPVLGLARPALDCIFSSPTVFAIVIRGRVNPKGVVLDIELAGASVELREIYHLFLSWGSLEEYSVGTSSRRGALPAETTPLSPTAGGRYQCPPRVDEP